MKTRKVGRDASSGKFVSKATVAANPKETIMDTVRVGKRDRDLPDEMKTLTVGLNFQSETDSEVKVFAPIGRRIEPVTFRTMEILTGLTLTEPPHYDFDELMDKCIRVQPMAERYKDLKAWMVENLVERQVFRMSDNVNLNRVTYFTVGLDCKGYILGWSAEAVET